MAKEDELIMGQRTRKKLYVLLQVIEGKLKQTAAAAILSLCVRQVRRLIRRVEKLGDVGVIHGNQGKKSPHRIGDSKRKQIIRLCRSRYVGFGPTLIAEKVLEETGIKVSDETIRKWLISEGLQYRRRRKPKHRKWRERKEYSGQMVQMDGSHHSWFEERGQKVVLMGYIDDATGTIFARFYDHEGTMPALDSLKRYVRRYGIPCSLYLDRHTTYKSPKELSMEDELQGLEEPQTQFKRAAEELGIEMIYAYSPQAKGRIERLFKTLQDRLVKEMRLRQINEIGEANKFLTNYLPVLNKKYRIRPVQANDMHRPIPPGVSLDWVLSRKETRALRNDFTVFFRSHVFQVLDPIRAKTITILQTTDGKFRLIHNGQSLKFKEINPSKMRKLQLAPPIEKAPRIPPRPPLPGPNHPWKQFRLPGSNPPLK